MLGAFVLVTAGTLTGLHAGLLYDFSVDVVRSMRYLKPKEHIRMMQAINIKIENPVFFLSFFGPVVLLPLATWLHQGEPPFSYLLAASLVEIIGCQAVTIIGNIPLNNELAKVDTNKISDQTAGVIRRDFQGSGSKWMIWHSVRTLAGITATVLVFVAALFVEA